MNRELRLALCGAFALASIALAASCGSSARLGGGISGTSSIVGAIAGFGSIVVNGIALDVDGASITIEGDPATEADLRLGMVATVRGTLDADGRTGVADVVAVEDLIEGPIEAIDRTRRTLRVLAQTVLLDPAVNGTVLEPTAFADLVIGDDVEVSGFLDADGRIRATRVQHKQADVEIEIKGVVAELDRAAQIFALGALTVDYAGALLEGLPPGGLADGLFVEVEAEEPPVGDVLIAVGIELPASEVDAGDGLDVAGFVTAVLSADEFVLNATQRVRLTSDTRFEGGTRADVVPNAALEVEGRADAGGVLVASEVELTR
ncbi:MAG: DUF5666 domain-containing protein [Thermodesulfobacteriota bacterium]